MIKERKCKGCIYNFTDGLKGDEDCPDPCKDYSAWEANVKETPWLEKFCHNCEHWTVYKDDEPCVSCNDYEKWVRESDPEPNDLLTDKPEPEIEIERKCKGCIYSLTEHALKGYEPCPDDCQDYSAWEANRIPGYQNWYINFEIDKQLKVIRNEQNDFEVEVKAALSDMEKGLIRLQNRFDKHLPKPYIVKPDPHRGCINCKFIAEDSDLTPCSDCIIRRNWIPKDKTEGCKCLD